MLMEEEREQIVYYGKKMSSSGLTNGTSGNISIFDPVRQLMAISPTGIGYFETTKEDIVVMDLDGNIVDGERKPSSEHELHATIYRMDKRANAIVHAHSIYCTTFACLRQPIVAAHYLIAGAESDVIPCIDYATYGSNELAEIVDKANVKGLAMLLANHGMVAIGKTLSKAFNVAENVEWCAEILWRCKAIGNPVLLSESEIDNVIKSFGSYGQDDFHKSGY